MSDLKDAVAQSIHAALVTHEGDKTLREGQQPFLKRCWYGLLHWFQQKLSQQQEDRSAYEAGRSTMIALQAVGQYLATAGLELGRDFSYTQGSLILNDLALAQLQQKLGPDQFDHIMKRVPDLLQHDPQTAAQALERYLGVPFFENLKQAMLQRLPMLTDAEIICYSTRLIDSFGYRHPEIKGFDSWVKSILHEAIETDRLRDIRDRYAQGHLKVGPDDGWILLIDLLVAAGGIEGVHFQKTEGCLQATSKGLQLLDQLIIGPDSRFADLV